MYSGSPAERICRMAQTPIPNLDGPAHLHLFYFFQNSKITSRMVSTKGDNHWDKPTLVSMYFFHPSYRQFSLRNPFYGKYIRLIKNMRHFFVRPTGNLNPSDLLFGSFFSLFFRLYFFHFCFIFTILNFFMKFINVFHFHELPLKLHELIFKSVNFLKLVKYL